MIEFLTDEELIIFLKIKVGEEITDAETLVALTAISRECPMFFYDQVMSKDLK